MTTQDSSSQRPRRKKQAAQSAGNLAEHESCAKETVPGLDRRVLAALEQERARIARELHDDIVQRIGILVWDLQEIDWQPSCEEGRSRKSLKSTTERLKRLASDIQTIAHRLHSSHVEYLGLTAAAEILCRDLCTKHQVKIEFTCRGIPRNLSKDISLCLYRVLQEGLQNATKHSQVKQFDVQLIGDTREVRLTIMDTGVGFDLRRTDLRQGLGLISMQERMRMVRGQFSIDSAPGGGTTIRCWVPTGTIRSQTARGQKD
jgi:signal transduction histidine kinase